MRSVTPAWLAVLGLALCGAGCAGPPAQPAAEATVEARRCASCGRDADADEPGPDGRAACRACLELAVTDGAELGRARAAAAADLARLFGIELGDERVTVMLVARRELLRLAGQDLGHPSLRGFTEVDATYHDGRLVRREFRVFVLRGLPFPELVGVLAHELFHVHQVQSGGGAGAAPAFREGAAMYVQHRILTARGAEPWAGRLVEDQDPVYGEGLRRFRHLAASVGEAEALRRGATGRDFPAGY